MTIYHVAFFFSSLASQKKTELLLDANNFVNFPSSCDHSRLQVKIHYLDICRCGGRCCCFCFCSFRLLPVNVGDDDDDGRKNKKNLICTIDDDDDDDDDGFVASSISPNDNRYLELIWSFIVSIESFFFFFFDYIPNSFSGYWLSNTNNNNQEWVLLLFDDSCIKIREKKYNIHGDGYLYLTLVRDSNRMRFI